MNQQQRQQLAQIIATQIEQQHPNQRADPHPTWIIIGYKQPWTYIHLQDDILTIIQIGKPQIGKPHTKQLRYADPQLFPKLHQHLQTLLT